MSTETPAEDARPTPPVEGETTPTSPVDGETTQLRTRRRQTVGDMVRSLAIVLALVAVLIGFNAVQQPDPVLRTVDYPAAIDAAQPGVDYPLAGPRPLPAGWRVTSARTGRDVDAVTWHLGMLTSDHEYAAVEQSDGSPARLLRRFIDGSRGDGSVVIDGVTWQRRVGGDPEPRALVARSQGMTVALVGTASWEELEALASALG